MSLVLVGGFVAINEVQMNSGSDIATPDGDPISDPGIPDPDSAEEAVQQGQSDPETPSSTYNGSLDKQAVLSEMRRAANERRVERGLQPLNTTEELRTVATYKAEKMEREDYVAHVGPDGQTLRDRFNWFSIDCQSYAENLARSAYKTRIDANYGGTDTYTTEAELADGVVKQFMNSPPHRETLLGDEWVTMGFGIDIDDDGKVYVTHVFCSSVP